MKLETSVIKTSEDQLRKLLDKMQLSLLEYDGKRVYLRSAQQPGEATIQKKLGVKPMPNIISVDQINTFNISRLHNFCSQNVNFYMFGYQIYNSKKCQTQGFFFI